MAINNKSRVWPAFLRNVIVIGLVSYGVYRLGIANGMPIAGLLLGAFTFLAAVGTQGYMVFRSLRDPNWNPPAVPLQIDPQTYSRLTSLARMLVGSPLSLPVALIKGLKHRKGEESKPDKNAQ